MDENERLDLLKEVAGTKIFEERRKESEKILIEQRGKQALIDNILENVDKRLEDILQESKELKEYLELEKQKKVLETAKYTQEKEKLEGELQDTEAQLALFEDSEKSSEHQEKRIQYAALSEELASIRKQLQMSRVEKSAVESVMDKLSLRRLKATAALEAALKDREEEKSRVDVVAHDLEAARKAVAENETKITEAKKVFQLREEKYRAIVEKKTQLEEKVNALLTKEQEHLQFATIDERNAKIKEDMVQVEAEKQDAETRRDILLQRLQFQKRSIEEIEQSIAEYNQDSEATRKANVSINDSLMGLMQQQRDKLTQLHSLRRENEALQSRIRELAENIDTTERSLFQSTPPHLRQGIQTIRLISDPSHPDHIPGIVGPLYDLFRPKHERYHVAVDAVAGNDLFNIVVESEEVGRRAIEYLSRTRSGRATFTPLTRVPKYTKPNFPEGQLSIPLLDLMQVDPQGAPAVQQVLGHALLCKSVEIAMEYAQSYNVMGVTLEGDIVGRRGNTTGGYVDPKQSRLGFIAKLYSLKEEREELQAQLQKTTLTCSELEKNVSALLKEKSEMETALSQAHTKLHSNTFHVNQLQVSLTREKRELSDTETQLAPLETLVATLSKQFSILQASLSLPLASGCTRQEKAQLQEMQKQLGELAPQVAVLAAEYNECNERVQSLVSHGEEVLYRELNELETRHQNLTIGSRATGANIGNLQWEKNKAESAEKSAIENLKKLQDEEKESNNKIAALESQLETLSSSLSLNSSETINSNMQKERILEKRNSLQQRWTSVMNSLRSVGPVNAAALEDVRKLRFSQIVKNLSEVVAKQRTLGNVDLNANEKLEMFGKQREELNARREELKRGETSLLELMETLHNQKEDALRRTFRQVQRHFSDIFKELIPRGSASLTLVTKADALQNLEANENEDEEDIESSGSQRTSSTQSGVLSNSLPTDSIVGVSISASFAEGEEKTNLSLCSGGQVTLLSLALIFAIQRTDPAPFYIFDEIDAALDPVHKTTVARFIQKISSEGEEPVQFITSTFGTELLECGKQFFGTYMTNGVSDIVTQTKEEAIAFLELILAEEAHPGEATSDRSYVPGLHGAGSLHRKRDIDGSIRSPAPAASTAQRLRNVHEQGPSPAAQRGGGNEDGINGKSGKKAPSKKPGTSQRKTLGRGAKKSKKIVESDEEESEEDEYSDPSDEDSDYE